MCDCPSYVASHEGTSSTCKHGSSLVLMGLLPKPCCVANTRAAHDDAREKAASVAPLPDTWEAKAAAIEAEAVVEVVPEPATPARVVAPFDADFYRAQNAVAERRAVWLAHRHLHTSDPLPAPVAARQVEAEPWCDPVEPGACAAVPTPPADLTGDASEGWSDDDVITLGPAADPLDDEQPARSLADQVLDHARSLRAGGSPLGDLLAERAEQLAEEIRYLGATTVGQYRDRREAALDAARDAAEARMAAARCC